MDRLFTSLRKPVKRKGAEQYLFLTLISFAASVILTRLFLELTGYPQLSRGDLHIAHLLWGGLLLFLAALLPIIAANRWVYPVGALLSGVGVGLFIDEVGKFITQTNDYFYPPAAPIIYAFFLLTVLLYLRMRKPPSEDPRDELYRVLDGLEDVLDHDLDTEEREDIEKRLRAVARDADHPDLARLAESLLEFVSSEGIYLAPNPPGYLLRLEQRWQTFEGNHLDRLRTRAIIAGGIFALGLVALSKLGQLLISSFPPAKLGDTLAALLAVGFISSPAVVNWFLARVMLEGSIGLMLFSAAILLGIGKDSHGIALSYAALLLSLTTVNLLVFYFDQFSTVITAIFQFLLLIGVLRYRKRFLTPERIAEQAKVP